jgi:tetratricopeptide (TPR) repeat protein
MRKVLYILSIVLSTSIFASIEGFKLLSYEKFNAAATAFGSSSDANAKFYQAYALLRAGKTADAKTIATTIATTPLGMVALGWTELNNNNSAGAKTNFDAALKASKNKDGLVIRMIGEAYVHTTGTKDASTAIDKIKMALTFLPKNAACYVALGDAYFLAQDGGSAITQYEYAETYDGVSAVPTTKVSMVYYLSKNYPFSKDYITKAEGKDANNTMMQREAGRLYYKLNKFDKAKEYFSKYMAAGEPSLDDKALYANILFLSKDYANAQAVISEIIKVDDKRNYLNRLIGYSNIETGKYAEGLIFMEKFMATQPKDKIIASDYEYLGKAMVKSGKDTAAGMLNMIKGAEMDVDNKDKWKDIADAYYAQKKYVDAANCYKKKIDPNAPSATDWFNVGNSYYKAKDFKSADDAFGKVIEIKPDAGTGYLWRAKANLQLDPEQKTASAKPFYEKYIPIAALDTVKYKKELIESYNYMAADAYNNMKDNTSAKTWATKTLALDPANETAKQIMTLK